MDANKIDFDDDLARFRAQSDQSIKILQENGFVVDMSQWLTIKRYAEKHSTSTQVVTNWISRGIVPADCTMTLPELNDIRLVKDQEYH